MRDKFVDLEALNIRSAPVISASTRIGILHLGLRVEELGSASEEGWVKIRVIDDGSPLEGVVKSEIDGVATLRDPVSLAREVLVGEAIKEWLRFEKGQGMEHHDPFYKFVGEMWQSIKLDLDGKDRDTPWSAAAISFMVRNAGKQVPNYKQFKFAASHSKFMHDSILKRKNSDTDAPFWGFRLHEKRPQIGDIVGKWRETPKDFEDAASGNAFKSHSDIIVSVKPDHVLAIGGNVDQSVSITRYEKTAAGFLAPKNATFIHLVNQA
ncbi:SH3 domain-containing C40 family peptidase [Crenobacter cavernae]|uniref:DUF2272 domain-containing protein n=1 Tax=Crenobacter cavernae TaxID=2290923 RepID=A0A345Y8P8_9NEIS|nr:SH3 domain-containing C40 family peptidase [Crenobacter cavernae]AXK40300.1 DUF2272 domain-containing protein [Crenobacter cavernae]